MWVMGEHQEGGQGSWWEAGWPCGRHSAKGPPGKAHGKVLGRRPSSQSPADGYKGFRGHLGQEHVGGGGEGT